MLAATYCGQNLSTDFLQHHESLIV